MEFLNWTPAVSVLIIGWGAIFYIWFVWPRMAHKESDLNDQTTHHPLVNPHQVRWHIAHMRSDVSGCVLLLAVIAVAVVWIAAVMTAKFGLPWYAALASECL